MPSQYPWSSTMKTVAVELWKAKVPLKKIRAQLNMPERTLRRFLAHSKANPGQPIAERKVVPGSGRYSKVPASLLNKMRKKLVRTPTLTDKRMRETMPELAHMSVCRIQELCLKKSI